MLKERYVNKDNTSLTLDDSYDHFKNLSEKNSFDNYIKKPKKYSLELREIHILKDPKTEKE